MSSSEATSQRIPSQCRHHRLWIPLGILLLALIAIGGIELFLKEWDSIIHAWLIGGVLLLTVIGGGIWFLLLGRFRWRTRLIVGALVGLSCFGLSQALRVDGTTDGRGLPRFAWKWSKASKAALPTETGSPLLSESATEPVSTDFPQFLGPNRDGRLAGANLSTNWISRPPRELWRHPIGAGWSGFAVVAGRAYTQEQRGEEESVTCYDLLSGRLLWSRGSRARFSQWQSGDGPHATPTVKSGKVFAYGSTGILSCLDATNGTPLWSRNVLDEHRLKNLEWGTSASPLLLDDLVVVTGGQSSGPTLLAYDWTSGEPRWHSGTDRASYSSPIVAQLAGRRVILSFNAATLTAHDPITGAVLLERRWGADKPPKAAQPVVLEGDRVFVTAGYGMGCEMFQVRPGEDGKLTAISLWKNMRMKAQFNTVAVRDGYLYGLDDGMLACVDAATGNRCWKEGRFGSGQSLLIDDFMLVQGERGPITLLAVSPDGCRELGQIPGLSSKTWNHPTLVGRYLLARNDREVVCYELPRASTP